MTIEIYKDVVGYEGLYQVSNLGNVKRISNYKCVNKKYLDNYTLKPLDNGKGYYRIKLCKNNLSKRVMLHRIIAEAFIPNPNNYKTINHINGDKKDNRIENLEWCTQSQNVLHAFKNGLKVIPKGDTNKLSRKIIDTKTGEIYHSSLTLSIKLGVNRGTLRWWLSNPSINKTSYRYI